MLCILQVLNLGTGRETSISELANQIKEMTGFKGRLVFDKTKPDGNPRRLFDNSKITAMGWKAKTSLEMGIKLTWEWYQNNQK